MLWGVLKVTLKEEADSSSVLPSLLCLGAFTAPSGDHVHRLWEQWHRRFVPNNCVEVLCSWITY
jgi:hypothetical protein